MAGRWITPAKWTDERIELLKEMWANGRSAAQIAAHLGGISRSAVIGKLHRLGRSGRSEAATQTARRNICRTSSRRRKKLGAPFAPVVFKGPKSAALFKPEPYAAQPHIHVPESERK